MLRVEEPDAPLEPNIEEVRKIRIAYVVVVGWVCNYGIESITLKQ